jgi:hypothetical protein
MKKETDINAELDARSVIGLLGGTTSTARLCKVTKGAVSQWIANNHIPSARLMFIRLARPDVFGHDRRKKSRT